MKIEATKNLLTLETKKKKKGNKENYDLKPSKEGKKILKKVVNDPDRWEDMKGKKLKEELSKTMPTINAQTSSLLHGNSEVFDSLEDAVDIFSIEKVQEAFKKVLKEYIENGNEDYCNCVFSIVSDACHNDPQKCMGMSREVAKDYITLFKKVKSNKKKIKKLINKLNLPEEMAISVALLNTYPKHCKLNGRVVSRKMQNLWAMLKKVDDLDKKDIVKILQICYNDKEIFNVAVALLNEKKTKNNETIYDVVSDAICFILNKADREKLTEVLKSNYKFVNKKNNLQCRLNEDCVEDYKTLRKVYAGLSKRGFTKRKRA